MTFKGDGIHLLIETIANYLDKKWDVYTRHASIVNSSRIGKSHIMDQMAKEIITVPICLRNDETEGFNLRAFFFDMLMTWSVRIPSSW